MRKIAPTPWQTQVIQIPQPFDLAVCGGRGLGKSWLMAFLVLQFIKIAGATGRALYVRRSLPSTLDFLLVCRYLFLAAFGKGVSFNSNSHIWTFPSGATLEINELSDYRSLDRFIGRSIGLLLIDQGEQFPAPELIDMMRSNLRSESDFAPRFVFAAHPGGVGDSWIRERYILPSTPWHPFTEPVSARKFVRTTGTWSDNPHLSDDYRQQLEAATKGDESLRKAWVDGDFLGGGRGMYFSGCYAEVRNVIDWPDGWVPDGFDFFVTLDFGVSAPTAAYAMARSRELVRAPDGHLIGRGSLVAFDEFATYKKHRLNEGQRLTISQLADGIKSMCERWRMTPSGVADPALFAATGSDYGSIADQFEAEGVRFEPAPRLGRIAGWERMREMLLHAGQPDRPGLFLSRRCQYALRTLPHLPRDRSNPEDLDSSSADHGADALRYGCVYEQPGVQIVPVKFGGGFYR